MDLTARTLIAEISGACGVKQDHVKLVLASLGDVARSALQAGDAVPLPGIGKLVVANRAARTSLNPKTQERLQTPAKRVAKLKPGIELRDALA